MSSNKSSISIYLAISVILHAIALYIFIPSSSPLKSEKQIALEKEQLEVVVDIVESNLQAVGIKFNKAKVTIDDMIGLPNSFVGVTYPGPQFLSFIKIRADYFMKAPMEIREALVLHEYGHYLGVLSHDDRYLPYVLPIRFPNKCPTSVMHSYDDMSGCFFLMREYYYKELKNKILDLNH